jgi:Mlc titration factor MtfA (ptsG expression regulator)
MLAGYRRKRDLRRNGFPDEWRVIIETNVVHWRVLSAADRELLEDYVVRLVTEKRWEAARGFALTDEIQVTIAAQAALLVLGLGYEAYRGVGTIIVHPTTMQLSGERSGPITGTRTNAPVPVLGVAHYEGPVIIAWDSARAGARHPERGHNVVYHEFAHKIDMLDGLVDGTPPLERDEERTRWIEVCTAEYLALRNGTDDGFLDGYAAVNPGEFFAVVTEAFFDIPRELEATKPDLYGVLRDFYRQDPARVARERAPD